MTDTIVNMHSAWCPAEKTHPEERKKQKRRKTENEFVLLACHHYITSVT
jgi:hypothetical protein